MSTLIVPRLQPDELFTGGLGRMAAINGMSFAKRPSIATLMRTLFPGVKADVRQLAGCFGISQSELLSRHSCHTYLRGSPYGTDPDNPPLTASVLVSQLAQCRVCVSCCAEDLGWFGFAFWRASHQAPGVRVCVKHEETLLESCVSPLNHQPNDLPAKEGLRRRTQVSRECISIRYAELARDIGVRPMPDNGYQHVLDRLRTRATELGVRRRNKKSRGPLIPLGDYARARSDASEIELILRATSRCRDTPWQALDSALMSCGNNVPRLCLLACIFYDDPSAAAACFRPEDSEEAQSRAELKRPGHSSTGALMRAYYECRGNYSRTAVKLTESRGSESKRSVYDRLRRRGIPNLAEFDDPRLMHAILAFHQGESLRAACERYSVAQERIEAVFRENERGTSALIECAKRILGELTQPLERLCDSTDSHHGVRNR